MGCERRGILAILHVRTPTNKTLSRKNRQIQLRESIDKLEAVVAKMHAEEGDTQHIACVLLGDCNLNVQEAKEAAQKAKTGNQTPQDVWQAIAPTGQKGGDVMLVKGGEYTGLRFACRHLSYRSWCQERQPRRLRCSVENVLQPHAKDV